MNVKGVFFDLDHTLWDYDTNARETLQELYHEYQLEQYGITTTQFHTNFESVNTALWDRYDRGEIGNDVIRKERFARILGPYGCDDRELLERLSIDYLHRCPRKNHLLPGAAEVLEYLGERYELTIITNGFEEIQHMKMQSGNLMRFFSHVVTSERAGHRKPAAEIFEFALRLNGFRPHEVVMVGDNPITDIGGARKAGIEPVHFNPSAKSDLGPEVKSIQSLQELKSFL